jgi:alkylation response protein AidB-like acyl-CoA dehydrogenase
MHLASLQSVEGDGQDEPGDGLRRSDRPDNEGTEMSDTSTAFLSGQEVMIRDSARKVAMDVVAPTAAERDRTSAWPRGELKTVGELGFLGMLIPEEYGGSGASFVEYCIAIEEFAAADTGFATLIHVHNSAGFAISTSGSPAQKRRYLPELARGERIGAFLLTEPHAGSDTAAFRTSARRDGSDFVLNGSKQFISNGSEAGVALVLAVTEKGAGKNGQLPCSSSIRRTPATGSRAWNTSSASARPMSRRSSSMTAASRPTASWAVRAPATR